jgi:hypothetical protein
MSTVHPSIEQHPDILALRASYDRAAESMTMQGTFGLTFLTALYCAVSPWVIGFDATTRLVVNDLIVGIAVAVLAFGFGAALDRTHGMTWTLPFIGIWLVVSPWVLRDVSPTAGMAWSNVITGALVFVFGLVAAYYGVRARSPEGR